MKRIYMDHAATTFVRREVLEAMIPFLSEMLGGNPSSVHSFGREAKREIEKAREQVATALGAQPNEIYFTSGGTESDNWAIRGAVKASKKAYPHIITSAIEHHAVLHACEALEKEDTSVSYIPVDKEGNIDLEALRAAIKPETVLISVMYANNEIGTLQPIEEIGKIAREKGVRFHTDAVQAIGQTAIDLSKLPVDMLSLSGHKIYGPKGIGALYIRKGVSVGSLFAGGAQERNKRSGTENMPGIIGLAKALTLITEELPQYTAHLKALQKKLIEGILEKIPEVRVNGSLNHRLPANVNVSIRYVEGESLLLSLDARGIAASSGSACTSGSLDPSHVLLAIGLPHEIAHGSLRLSLGRENTMADVDKCLEVLPEIVEKLRAMSPLGAQKQKE